MNTFMSIMPIGILIYIMTKKKPLPSYKALPAVAGLLYFLKLTYFSADPNQVNATVLSGLLTAWTPILIVWGAIFLFKTMQYSGSMKIISQWLNDISTNKVAQLMIIGWSFAFLIEGASGFGTPAALAAPILVGLGFNPLKVAILCLIMNSVPVSFGAVGTPTWFGFGDLGLSSTQINAIGLKSATIHSIAAMIIPLIALSFVVTWNDIKKNIGFIYLSILSSTIPYLALASVDYEFPSLLGGGLGLILTVFFAHKKIGLAKEEKDQGSEKKHVAIAYMPLIKATFPIWGIVLLLLITRIRQIGIKDVITSMEPLFSLHLGSLGDLLVTNSLTLELKGIFETTVNWRHKLLYVPSLLPFFAIAFFSFFLFKMSKSEMKKTWKESFEQMKFPIIALMGALVFVKLLMSGGENACSIEIGRALASIAGTQWKYFASYLGALGAFFAGSNTISNLTFGDIQMTIAANLNLKTTTILALQSVGGAMGNMVCINNIVAVCVVLGISEKEGYILKRTVIPMLIYGIIAAIVAAFL